MDKINEKLDKIVADIGEIKVTMATNTVVLEEHIRRTEIAELNINSIKEELAPIKTHVILVQSLGSIIYTAVKVIGVLATVLSVIHVFKIL